MGALFSPPSVPQMPVPPPPPTQVNASIINAGAAARARAAADDAGTIMTSPQGAAAPATATKSLLGGGSATP